MSNQLPFKISSNLKNIIGRELITDDFIAVFELVKNSFDAYSREVRIIFDDDKLVIKDNGKGMDYNDLKDKWLFVAYSAKNEGVEDQDETLDEMPDYRDRIQENKFYAGAKGIGRFSCDKLGDELILFTRKAKEKAKFEKLIIKWKEFEKDPKEEFISINVEHETINKVNDYPDFIHGTILEIKRLSSFWNRDNILKLKHSLEKLINPIDLLDKKNKKVFSIIIEANGEIENDKNEKHLRNKINGPVKNFIFETLGLKTTQIITKIDSNGEFVKTTLTDRGTFLYELEEKNNSTLKNITFNLFYLNRAAKVNFSKLMNIPAVQFGSVFLFRNEFRVYPFGEVGEDNLKIDRRKQQGFARYLGTRDLLGRITIIDDEAKFQETSSRDGGLIQNESYNELINVFRNKCLKRLESYVVDIQWKTKEIRETDYWNNDISALDNPETKKDIMFLFLKIANATKDISDFRYNTNFVNIIKQKIDENLPKTIQSLTEIARKTKNPELEKQIDKLERFYKKSESQRLDLEESAKLADEARIEGEEQLEQTISQNFFLKSLATRDFDQVVSILHHIGISSNTIEIYINRLNKKFQKGLIPEKKYLEDIMSKIGLENRKILSFSKYATKADFKLQEEFVTEDLIAFIKQYLQNIKHHYPFKIRVSEEGEIEFSKKFRPIDIIIVFDNLLSNSKKHNSKNVLISISQTNDQELLIKFIDDGSGLNKKIKEPTTIFDKGVTTTNTGSGLGLFHVKQVIDSLEGLIKVNANIKNGLEFSLRIPK